MPLTITNIADKAQKVTIELPQSIDEELSVEVKPLAVIGTSVPIAHRRTRKGALKLNRCFVEGSSAQSVIDLLKKFTLVDSKTLTTPTLALDFGSYSMARCCLVELRISAEWFPDGKVTKAFLDLTLTEDPEPKKPLKEDLSKLTAKEKSEKLRKLQEAVTAGKFKEIPKDYTLTLNEETGKVNASSPDRITENRFIGLIEALEVPK